MPLDSQENPAKVVKSAGLMDRLRSLSSDLHPDECPNPPDGNTGGTLRQTSKKYSKTKYIGKRKTTEKEGNDSTSGEVMPQTTPLRSGGGKRRASRAKISTNDMQEFLSRWFFDWLTITIPNPLTGKGEKTQRHEHYEKQELDALDRMTSWAAIENLRRLRLGGGTDGYKAGLNLAFDPTDSERIVTIRAGHQTNMPGMEIPGGRGHCAALAKSALAALGPVMLAKADVSLDVQRSGLFDELCELCVDFAEARKMESPRLYGDEQSGRTIYLGKGNRVKIYEKGKERIAKKTAEEGEDAAHPELVRIEFTIVGDKKKQALGKIAAEDGPGALLPTVFWIRSFIERLAVILGDVAEEEAVLAVKRLEPRPDPRPIEVRAAHGRKQYCKIFVAEAAKSCPRRRPPP